MANWESHTLSILFSETRRVINLSDSEWDCRVRDDNDGEGNDELNSKEESTVETTTVNVVLKFVLFLFIFYL